jgi:hypothetical protein
MSDGTYVARGGEQVFAPPFLQKGTRLTAFAVEADPSALQRTCDRLLNEPAGGAVSYRALGRHVLFVHAPIASTQSTRAPDHDLGWTPETDVAFWMLVGAGREREGQWTLERLAWLLPYVWVDVPVTMATGREVYGYPKEMAWLTYPDAPDAVLPFELATLVLPTHTPETELVRRPLIRVERVGTGHGRGPRFADVATALDQFREAVTLPRVDWHFWAHLIESLLRREVPMVFLKQFRDAVDPSRACYQAILESPARIEGLPYGWPLLGSHRITLHDYASHPIARDLGLGQPAGGELSLSPCFAFEAHFDFLVDTAHVIWQR